MTWFAFFYLIATRRLSSRRLVKLRCRQHASVGLLVHDNGIP